MKHKSGLLALTACAAAFAFVAATPAQSATNLNTNDSSNQAMASNSGRAEAAEMVPARAAIDRTLDAKDARAGQPFQAKLANKVHLKDGTELPRGTMLIGKVGTDDMHETGRSKLVLCIDQAKLKNGQTIPLKATIVGLYGPDSGNENFAGYTVNPGDQDSNDWSHHVLQVDQINALSGVDLHSKIGSRNSGVLVSTKKDDIKIKDGTELALAIAGENQNQGQNDAPAGSGR